MAKPLLTLETLAPDRPSIEIDGVRYDLALPDDFGLLETAHLQSVMRRAADEQSTAQALPKDAYLDDAARQRLSALLSDAVKMVMRDPLPADVLERLNSTQKVAIIATFGTAVPKRAETTPTTENPDRPSTSANSAQSSPPPIPASPAGM